ncbi:MAG: hypothetical protein JNK49_14870 [Planctomycetes bacterium]|nr:hypothetical protein [Planctomycetota bacterium]
MLRSTCLFLGLLASCSGSELVGIHLDLSKGSPYAVTTRSLVESTMPGPMENRTQGVQWKMRAALVCSQGDCPDLGKLEFGNGGIRISTEVGGHQPSLRVQLKRGPGVDWLRALVPEDGARLGMAKVYDPTGKTKEIGDAVRLEITAPGEVVTSGVHPTGRGVEANLERNRAYLILPLRAITEPGEDLVWDVSWRQPSSGR